MNGDYIQNLPTDNHPVKPQELQIVENFFKPENKQNVRTIINVLKDSLIAGVLFFLLSTPFANNILQNFYSENSYYSILLKTSIFIFLFFIISNLYLIRLNN